MRYQTPWNIEKLMKRFSAAKSNWQLWRSLHQEAYDYSMPDNETFRARSPGQRKNRNIFDSTAVDGLEIFANKVQGGFFPDWLDWINFEAGMGIPEAQQEEINTELENTTKAFFGYFHQSNFSTEIAPALKDWGIGTGGIDVEESSFDHNEPLFRFSNIPLAEIYPERPAYGSVKSSWREHKVEASNIVETWPNADLPGELKKLIQDKPFAKVNIINGHLYDTKSKQYWQIIIYPAKKHVLFAQQFKTKRRIIFRASVTPGEVFGRGPIIRMLPDIRTLNVVKQFILQNGAIQISGVYTAIDDGVFNPHTVRITPGAVMPVSSNSSQNPTLRALDRAGDIGLGGIILSDLQDGIRKSLLAEPLGDINDPVRTLGEQIIRQQEDLKRQNTAFGRLYSELVVPLVKACLEIAQSRGFMPDFTVDGKTVKLRLVSPLAKQQDNSEFQNSQVWFQNISQLDPSVIMGSVKVENLPKFWAEKLGVPSADVLRTKEEQQQIAEAAMQSAQSGLMGGAEGGQEPV